MKMTTNLVDTVDQVKDLVSKIESANPNFPFLFIDLEGINLSRHGSISIMQILVAPEQKVYLLDIHRLQQAAFETESASGLSFHKILESEIYPKVIFDVRTDSDALFAHYDIRLRCVVDLQLLEFITRRFRGEFLNGLAKCIQRDLNLSLMESNNWNRTKELGKLHFAPERGGTYEVFNERPMKAALVEYCIQDVQMMPRLLLTYAERLRPSQAIQVLNETKERIKSSQGLVPIRKGRHMAIGPWFATVYSETDPVVLPHPMDIICSRSLRTYCDALPASISTFPAPVPLPQIHQEDTTPIPSTVLADTTKGASRNPSPDKNTRNTKPAPEDVENQVPPPAPTPPIRSTTPQVMTVTRALNQLSLRKDQDFTLAGSDSDADMAAADENDPTWYPSDQYSDS